MAMTNVDSHASFYMPLCKRRSTVIKMTDTPIRARDKNLFINEEINFLTPTYSNPKKVALLCRVADTAREGCSRQQRLFQNP
jgi:hypothetical protein